MAPKIVVVFALVFGNFTVALAPLVDHAKERFILMWNAASSMNTQLLE
jgi:hypothetical protein